MSKSQLSEVSNKTFRESTECSPPHDGESINPPRAKTEIANLENEAYKVSATCNGVSVEQQ